jgi:hypothetical protein
MKVAFADAAHGEFQDFESRRVSDHSTIGATDRRSPAAAIRVVAGSAKIRPVGGAGAAGTRPGGWIALSAEAMALPKPAASTCSCR